MLRHTRVGDSI